MARKSIMHIACDLDGTLAHYDRWRGIEHIGAPIAGTLRRVKAALALGHDVTIFTARLGHEDDADEARAYIEVWCREHVGQVLPATATKLGSFDEFWDDRAVSIVGNQGRGAAANPSLWDDLT